MKKLLSLFVLLVAIVMGAKADDVYKLQLNSEAKEIVNDGDPSTTLSYFDNSAAVEAGKFSFNTKYNGCTYDGVSYTKGLKMEGATVINFTTTSSSSTVVIVQSTSKNDGNTIKFDDSELAIADGTTITGGRVYTIENVVPGNHSVARGSGEAGLFAITVTEAGSSTTPKITASDASVKATESGVAATVEVSVTGANLTGSTLTATLSGAPTGMSVALDQSAISEGAISATATVSYSATENANGTATLTFSDGTTTKDVTITYKAKITYTELKTISDAHTWDIVNDVTGNVDFTDADINKEFVYADIDGLTFNDNFDEEALSFKGQYPRRTGRTFAQNGTLHFKTSVAGTIKVKFSDTGTGKSADAVKRYLRVNGENTEYWASRENNGAEPYDAQLDVTSGEIPVEAGDVYIDGSSALVYYFVTFTPSAAPTTETITIPSDGVLTYVTQNALDFSTINGAFKAYVPTSVNEAKTSVATAEVTSVPAGTALLLKGAAGSYDVEIAESATAPAANLFLVSDGNVQGADNIFAYHKTNKKFMKVASTVTIPAGKCYLKIEGVGQNALDVDFEGEATAVEAIAEANANAAAPVKVIKNGKLYIGNYNVAGQQVK